MEQVFFFFFFSCDFAVAMQLFTSGFVEKVGRRKGNKKKPPWASGTWVWTLIGQS